MQEKLENASFSWRSGEMGLTTPLSFTVVNQMPSLFCFYKTLHNRFFFSHLILVSKETSLLKPFNLAATKKRQTETHYYRTIVRSLASRPISQ